MNSYQHLLDGHNHHIGVLDIPPGWYHITNVFMHILDTVDSALEYHVMDIHIQEHDRALCGLLTGPVEISVFPLIRTHEVYQALDTLYWAAETTCELCGREAQLCRSGDGSLKILCEMCLQVEYAYRPVEDD